MEQSATRTSEDVEREGTGPLEVGKCESTYEDERAAKWHDIKSVCEFGKRRSQERFPHEIDDLDELWIDDQD